MKPLLKSTGLILFILTVPVLSLLRSATPAFADCSTLRGTDSGVEFGLPGYIGNDNPGNDHGSYAPDANWHDLWLYDCGNQQDNWSKDQFIRWGPTEKQKLDSERLYRTIVHEVRLSPLYDYDNTGRTYTSLPISGVDHGSWWEEQLDGYREVEFQIWDPGLIQADTNYYAHVEWQRFDNDVRSDVYAESEYCDNDWSPLYYDEIGWAHVEFHY